MMLPNLARRPFLNARPVWVVTGTALAVALAMAAVNVRLYLVTNRELAERIELRDDLAARDAALREGVGEQVRALEQVPWGSLANRVRAANDVLREGAFSWLELLDDLERVMPYDVRVTRVSPRVEDEAVTLQIEAVCKTRDDLLELLQRLIDDPRFSQPTPASEQSPGEGGEIYYSLRLSVLYHPDRGGAP